MERSTFYIIIVVLILGFIFNPDSKDFEEYLVEKSVGELEQNMLTKEIMGGMVSSLFLFERKDYKVFSMYEMKGLNLLQNEKIRFIGVFGFFIQIEGENPFD